MLAKNTLNSTKFIAKVSYHRLQLGIFLQFFRVERNIQEFIHALSLTENSSKAKFERNGNHLKKSFRRLYIEVPIIWY